jgi:integrase
VPKFVEGLAAKLEVPAGKRDVIVFDDALPGFFIRKFANGRASYGVKYNIGPKQRKLTFGAVIPGVLSEMRKKASEVLARARIGQDVTAEKRAAAGKRTITLAQGVSLYLKDREPNLRPRYFAEIKRQLEKDWKPLHKKLADAITRQDVIAEIDRVAVRQGNIAADRAHTALGGLYTWLIERGICMVSPTLNIGRRADIRARNRVLSEAELVEIWHACRDDDYGRIVKLLILTGQRRQEIGDLMWSEVNLAARQIELPAERTKNHRPHLVLLADEAHAILTGIEVRDGHEFVFGRGEGGFSGWSKAKAELDQRIRSSRKAALIKKPMTPWVLHDLRRSFITHINERKIALPHVVEALANHVSGHLAGVAGVYNKALYLDERRQAIDLWGRHLAAMIDGHPRAGGGDG